MDAENDIWSRALEVERTHGNRAQAYVAGRIDASRRNEDLPDTALWTEIAARLRHLDTVSEFRLRLD